MGIRPAEVALLDPAVGGNSCVEAVIAYYIQFRPLDEAYSKVVEVVVCCGAMVKLKGAVLFPFQRHFYCMYRSTYVCTLSRGRHIAACLRVVDQALFVVCLDDVAPDSLAELCGNFMCGAYRPVGGVEVGTCTNRWCDKVRTCFSRRHSNI
jgi:hypothetical protein